jgi:hypothetical protein
VVGIVSLPRPALIRSAAEVFGGASVPDEIGVHCHHQQGVVTLTCDEEAFAQLLAVVASAAGQVAAFPTAVGTVVIKRAEPPSRPTPWLDLFGSIGCVVVVTTVILLLGVGAYTLSRWVWQP